MAEGSRPEHYKFARYGSGEGDKKWLSSSPFGSSKQVGMGPMWMNDPPASEGARFPVEGGTVVVETGRGENEGWLCVAKGVRGG